MKFANYFNYICGFPLHIFKTNVCACIEKYSSYLSFTYILRLIKRIKVLPKTITTYTAASHQGAKDNLASLSGALLLSIFPCAR